ncbi:porin [Vogesella sp. LIG4]|uniref:porin n=1 Tax=Vogesella sp. LIG4 TaxID=1192162 RepID=UPI00081F88A1|nr:porin [Vogesella sp. LIG4]SCK16695.1 Outer membrane protein (porin) [Vogesella sp. LIG4]
MKKLIVLATLAALPAVAMADVTISGDLAVGIVNTKNGGPKTDPVAKHSLTTENRTQGEIKFAGSDDIGNGLKAIWQIASRINLADQSIDARDNLWAGRDSFVGLTGGFGTLTMGNIYIMPTSGAMSIFENENATWKSLIYDQGFRANNMVSYQTPNLGGFTGTVQHSFGVSSGDEQARLYAQAVSLAYQGNGFAVSYDGSRFKENSSGDFTKLHELNGSVTLGDLKLMAAYAQGTSGVLDAKIKGYGVGAAYTYGNFVPKFEYWHEGNAKIAGTSYKTGSNNYALGVEYGLSKRTRAGVEYVRTNYKSSDLENANVATVYLGTKF